MKIYAQLFYEEYKIDKNKMSARRLLVKTYNEAMASCKTSMRLGKSRAVPPESFQRHKCTKCGKRHTPPTGKWCTVMQQQGPTPDTSQEAQDRLRETLIRDHEIATDLSSMVTSSSGMAASGKNSFVHPDNIPSSVILLADMVVVKLRRQHCQPDGGGGRELVALSQPVYAVR